ncbi:glycosyltransferase [Tersicoccus sp. Bi-70]|uniref:glycosyltransferase n=1 Tax=Tersicoccus sp. Bi-70 TaxID=1897634 RepID=UPI000977AB8C|nr:glycosyltransferase [Tersicoccus sp. Bi-70]OMH31370.1 hypothetical protein BGP79_10165 [Tersicoccus sp. Bi-70]
MSAPLLDRVRVYESVRTAHLERAAALRPASILYRVRRYDFDAALADGLPLVQAGPLRTARLLWGSAPRELEVNEPLMLSAVPAAALAVAAVRVSDLFRRRPRTRVVSYAIGNADPFPPPSASAGLKSRVRRVGERALAHWLWHRLDVVVFGTDGARETYRRALGTTRARLLTVPALPEPCSCAAMEGTHDGDRAGRVLFLGALSERKGVDLLLQAWPVVRRARPDARLRIVGKGALQGTVEAAAATDPSIEVLIDPPRARIHVELAAAAVLALPSQPSRTWREQVGLPIVEALAHGTRVVTTTETGLADWLTEHGHRVVDGHADAAVLADALIAALASGPSPDEVRAGLPARDGRLAADDAMFDAADR